VYQLPQQEDAVDLQGSGEIRDAEKITTDTQYIRDNSKAAQYQADGLLVPVAENHGVLDSDLVDPANTTDPINDAVSALTAENYKGKVLLPYGPITQEAPISMADSISLVNPCGHARSFAEEGTVVEFPASVTTWIDYSNGAGTEIDGVNFVGQGQTTHTGVTAADFGSSKKGAIHWGRVGFQNFSGEAVGASGSGGPFASRFDYLYCQNVDAGNETAVFNVDTAGPQNWIGTLHAYPKNANSGSASTVLSANNGIAVDQANIGGTSAQLAGSSGANWPMVIRMWSFEPDIDGQFNIFSLGTNTYIGPGIVRANALSSSTGSSTWFVNDYGGENNHIMRPLTQDWSFSNNVVGVQNEPTAESWYYGPDADVTQNHSGTTGKFRSMASAGTGSA